MSATTPPSAGSNGAKKTNYRYRTVNCQSTVDETLFGTPHRLTTAARMRAEKQQNNLRTYFLSLTIVQLRNVPEDPTCTSVIIDTATYQRLSNAAKVQPKVVREQEVQQSKQNRECVEEELERRKKAMQEYDLRRKKNTQLEDVDQEAKEEAEYMLKRANELRQEQEDEIKHLNELILNAKCHAIRDAQILEKQQVKREMKDEDKRLDMMMEIERLNSLKIQEEIEKRRHLQAKEGASLILKQIEENDKEKMYKEEIREQENQAMLEYMQKLQEKDWEEFSKRKEGQKKLATDLLAANREIEENRVLRKEQDRIADLAVLEFQKAKAAREAAQEAE
ncbi:unnamed protein product, partial [Didymodactylos carnosus]